MARRIDNYSILVPYYMKKCINCQVSYRRNWSLFCCAYCTHQFFESRQAVRICGFIRCKNIIPFDADCVCTQCVDDYTGSKEVRFQLCDGCNVAKMNPDYSHCGLIVDDQGKERVYCSRECFDINHCKYLQPSDESALVESLKMLFMSEEEELSKLASDMTTIEIA